MQPLSSQLDRLGIGLSALCLAQCLLLPVAATAAPSLAGSILSDEVFHQLLVWFILPVSILAFGIGCRRHRHMPVLIPAILGVAAIVAAVVMGHEGTLGQLGARGLTLLGAGLLATAHFLNFRLCRQPGLCSGHTA